MDEASFSRCNLFSLPLTRVQAHGSDSSIEFCRIAEGGALAGACNFIDFAVIPPGATIGRHRHAANEEEFYLVMEGQAQLYRDGRRAHARPRRPGAQCARRRARFARHRSTAGAPVRLRGTRPVPVTANGERPNFARDAQASAVGTVRALIMAGGRGERMQRSGRRSSQAAHGRSWRAAARAQPLRALRRRPDRPRRRGAGFAASPLAISRVVGARGLRRWPARASTWSRRRTARHHRRRRARGRRRRADAARRQRRQPDRARSCARFLPRTRRRAPTSPSPRICIPCSFPTPSSSSPVSTMHRG